MNSIIQIIFIFLIFIVFPAKSQNFWTTYDSITYTLGNSIISLSVDLKTGARISSLKYEEKELLYIDRESYNWGSTFWYSPQTWKWPPSKQLDAEPYDLKYTGGNRYFISAPDTDKGTGLQFKKNLSLNTSDTSFTIDYTSFNTSGTPFSMSPWEVTRFPSGGITFFPHQKESEVTGDLAAQVLDSLDVAWFDYDSSRVPETGNPKFFADGEEGWLAHITNDRIVVIKSFVDSPPSLKAPFPENEIEHYTYNGQSYQESEVQGPFTEIPSNDSLSWRVKWFIRRLPESIALMSGNYELVAFVRRVIGTTITKIYGQRTNQEEFEVRYLAESNELMLQPEKNSGILISDCQGRIVLQKNNIDSISPLIIPKKDLNPGIYLIQCFNKYNRTTKKIIID